MKTTAIAITGLAFYVLALHQPLNEPSGLYYLGAACLLIFIASIRAFRLTGD